MDILKRVYYSICDESLHTRKEIAEHIDVSTVTVGKAVATLTKNGFIISNGKLSGELGRKSEFLDIFASNNVLLIDLTSDDFSYSLSPMSRDSIDPVQLEYVSSLDFADNLSLLLSHIRSSVKEIPRSVFVAVPGTYLDGRLAKTHISDYSTVSLTDIFTKYSIIPTEIISCYDITSRHCDSVSQDTVFVYVGNQVWGSFKGKYLKSISNVPVGGSLPLTYADALKCANSSAKITKYTLRFLDTLDAVLSPDTILLHSERFSREELSALSSRMTKLKLSDSISPVFYGLMDLCIDRALNKKFFYEK